MFQNKSSFFIRPYYVKEEDKAILDKDMNRLCYEAIMKVASLAYSSPVILISRNIV